MRIHVSRLAVRAAAVGAAAIVLCGAASVARRPARGTEAIHDAAEGERGRSAYTVTYLVSDGTTAPHQDANLVNGWGIAAGPTTPWWVSDNETSASTLYNGDGVPQALVVQTGGNPTGIVFNGTTSFPVTDGTNTASARFIFASEDGTIRGWSPAVPPPPPSTQAWPLVNNSVAGAVYKGLALASTAAGDFLYATDFHNARVDVFDGALEPVTRDGAFTDPMIPPGFAPFGIQNVRGKIVVTYAKQDADAHDDVKGQGLGFVDVYDTDGVLLARAATRGLLNAPWGIAAAPAGFGRASGELLVGNFGDGHILRFAMTDDMLRFEPRGALRGANGTAIAIDGLWGIAFGNGAAAGPANTLYFAAGPNDEGDGAFGRIDAAAESDED